MTAFARTSDIEDRWRPLSEDEEYVAARLLEDASLIIRARVADIDARIANGRLDAGAATLVAVAMVLRVLKHPDAIRSETDTFADFTHSRTYDQAVSGGLLYLDDTELTTLSKRGARAFSVAPAQEPTTAAHLERVAEHDAAWGRLPTTRMPPA